MQRRYRLRNASDFALLRKHGRRYHHPLLILIARPNSVSISRFGFAASRQVGKATARNRAKRLMRESVRSYQTWIPDGWDCLFIARQGSAAASLDQVKAAIGQTMARAQILADIERRPTRSAQPAMSDSVETLNSEDRSEEDR